jgi:hypothetical protein
MKYLNLLLLNFSYIFNFCSSLVAIKSRLFHVTSINFVVSNSPGKRLHVPACVIDDAQVLPGNTNKLLDWCIKTQLGRQVLNRKHWLTTIKFSARWLQGVPIPCRRISLVPVSRSGDAEDGREAWQEGRATTFTEDEALPLLFSYIYIYF